MSRMQEHGRRRAVAVVVIVTTLALPFGEGLLEHVRFAANPWHFNDDARQQTWPLLRYADADLFPDDYIADYFLAMLPRGYQLFYSLSAPFVDPRALGKIVPYVELLVVLYALVSASWSLAGPAAAWGTGALCLSTGVFLKRMAGGLPRSFAFPLVALALLALVRGKPRRLCLLTVLGAAFYYPAGVLIGFTTAAYLLLMPRSWQGEARAWSPPRRLAALAVTAAAAALLALPAFVAGRAYGPLLGPGDAAAYPEAGRGGRYDDVDLALSGELGKRFVEYARDALLWDGPPWSRALRKAGRRAAREGSLGLWLGCLVLAGYASLLAADAGARRMLALVVAPFALYELAVAFSPHLLLPARYLAYTLPLLTPVLLPTALASLVGRWRLLHSRPIARGTIVVVGVVLALLYLGARGPGHTGIRIEIPREERPLYSFLARLPPDSMIAGWPGGSVDNVPYLSSRKILVGYEVHQAFHESYAAEMRRRMRALIDAYLADDLGPLLRLRDTFGVTHLLVNRDHFAHAAPTYFQPFDAMIEKARRAARGPAEVLRLAGTAGVFEAGPLVVLDLSRIDERPSRASDGA